MKETEQGALERKTEFQEQKIREWAITLGINANDIYQSVNLVFRTHNQYDELENKRAEIAIAKQRISLDGSRFLIDQYYVAKKLRKIQRRQEIGKWFKKHFTPKRKSGQPPR